MTTANPRSHETEETFVRGEGTAEDGRFQLGHDLAGLLEADEDNLVMIKANYWVGL